MWSSFPRRRESSNLKAWIPASAGMTIKFQGGGVNGYHAEWEGKILYLKFTMDHDEELLLVSFKEK